MLWDKAPVLNMSSGLPPPAKSQERWGASALRRICCPIMLCSRETDWNCSLVFQTKSHLSDKSHLYAYVLCTTLGPLLGLKSGCKMNINGTDIWLWLPAEGWISPTRNSYIQVSEPTWKCWEFAPFTGLAGEWRCSQEMFDTFAGIWLILY